MNYGTKHALSIYTYLTVIVILTGLFLVVFTVSAQAAEQSAAPIAGAEAQQAYLLSWVDFLWELVQHPFVSLLIGIFGGAHASSGVRGTYSKAAKSAVHKAKELNPIKK